MRMIGIFLTLSLSLIAAQAVAADGCGENSGCGSANQCARCGCQSSCQKCTCQLICGMEKVKKYCWEVKCEEFCPLLPGRPCQDCNSSGNTEPCQECKNVKGGEKCPCLHIVQPRTANARVKKTLVKKEYECERPKYKTVVQYLCPECAACGSTAAPVTPAPTSTEKPSNPTPAPEPPTAPPAKSTFIAPLPPVVGTSYVTK